MFTQSQELGTNAAIKKVFPLLGDQIDHYWPQVCGGLSDCPGWWDFYTPEWTYTSLKMGRLTLWALSDGAIRGIVLTQILEFPRQRVFEIVALFGIDMLYFFKEMEDVFEYIAQENKCGFIQAICRPGLQRMLKDFHPETTKMLLRRAVTYRGNQ